MLTTHTLLQKIFSCLIIGLLLSTALLVFSRPAQAQCGSLDVVFVVDDTGSLGGALNSIKSEVNQILADINTASRGDYRLALVTFKDNVTVQENFADQNRDSIAAKIQALSASGGNRIPEASDEALNTVINKLAAGSRPQIGDFTGAFRDNAYKVIILITDAPPGGFDDVYIPGVTDVRAHLYATQAAAKGIKLSGIYVPTFPNDTATIKPIMQDYATTTSGFYLETAQDGTGTAAAIRKIIGGCGSTTTVPTQLPVVPTDNKSGSVLYFNLYTSDISNPGAENTLITLTNLNETKSVSVRLFFVEGDTGKIQEFVMCLLPTRHANLLASEFDPGIKGYVVAIATDNAGCPINFNYLIGSSVVKMKSGHQAYLNAISFAALANKPAQCDEVEELATLKFDGFYYDLAPRVLAVENFASPLDGNSTLLVINRMGGNFSDSLGDGLPNTAGVGNIGGMSGVLYDDNEKAYNINFIGNTPQQRNLLRDGYPRMLPVLTKNIPSGHSGWIRFSPIEDNAIVGAAIAFNPRTMQNHGNNLHQIALTGKATLIIPLTPSPIACN